MRGTVVNCGGGGNVPADVTTRAPAAINEL
jgi:hypothetical protein